jgi:hypothetical protein
MVTVRKPTAQPAATVGALEPTAAASVSADERALMIARAAYQRAERRGFTPGHELEDWLAAEREINHVLGAPSLAEIEAQN